MTAELEAQLSLEALQKIGSSDLSYDREKLEQLAQVALDEQVQVVRCHLSLGMAWETALEGRTLRLPEDGTDATTPASAPPAPPEPAAAPEPAPPVTRRFERWPIGRLRPNRFNMSLFPDSLGEASIALIAEDLGKNGQRVPVEVTPDGELIDGERRWRGAGRLQWEHIDVVVSPALSDDDMLNRVIDACTATRHMSVREQVNVYAAVCEQLKREAGRQAGRPEKIISKDINYVTPLAIRDAAAVRAGFSSSMLAVRAEAVFTKGSKELQEQVREGSLAITAAYKQLSKRPKRKRPEGAETDSSEASDSDSEGSKRGETKPAAASAETAAQESSEAGDDTPPRDEAAPASAHDTEGSASAEAQKDPHAEPAPADETGESADREPQAFGDADPEEAAADVPDDSSEVGVGHHVDAVCAYLTRMAATDFDGAVSWFNEFVEQMRSAVGEPPDADEVEQRSEGEDEDFDLLSALG